MTNICTLLQPPWIIGLVSALLSLRGDLLDRWASIEVILNILLVFVKTTFNFRFILKIIYSRLFSELTGSSGMSSTQYFPLCCDRLYSGWSKSTILYWKYLDSFSPPLFMWWMLIILHSNYLIFFFKNPSLKVCSYYSKGLINNAFSNVLKPLQKYWRIICY